MTFASMVSARLSRRLLTLAGVLVFALSLAACFDNEPAQRAAFIKFLQTRIIDKPGLHIPILSDKETADLGAYVDQYHILNGFHHRLDESVSKDLRKVADASAPRSMEELREKRAIISALKRDMAVLKVELDKVEADTDAAHKALQQPADLKVAYDKAYERMVTIPAKTFRELIPIMETGLPAIEELAVYLDEHRDTIELHGNSTVVKDAKVRAKLTTLMQAAVEAAKSSEEGKRKLRAMAEGIARPAADLLAVYAISSFRPTGWPRTMIRLR